MNAPPLSAPQDASPSVALAALPRCERMPLVMRIAKWLNRRVGRGGWRLLYLARARGWLDRLVPLPLEGNASILLPLRRPENWWDERDLAEYEAPLVARLAEFIGDAPATLLDVGADVGLLACKLAARCPQLHRIEAYEPGPEPCSVLALNLAALHRNATAHQQAASDWSGRARLVRPLDKTSDHTCYITPAPDGPIEVVRLDELSLSADDLQRVVLKLDVEGEELPALRGAARLIRSAESIAVAFEAHPEVAVRTGVDPIECLRYLETLRIWEVAVSELPSARIDSRRNLFEQIPAQIANVVCVSRR